MQVSFEVSPHDHKLISEISKRAVKVLAEHGTQADLLTICMDLTAVHANGCALRLDELKSADEFNLIHDIAGIARHLNRDTGKLMDCFVPRFREREPTDWRMTLDSQDHEDMMAMFEQLFSHFRLDREAKEFWPKGNVYQNGETNSLFLAFRQGVAYGRAIER